MNDKPKEHPLIQAPNKRFDQILDGALCIFSIYGIPLAVALTSLLALIFWQTQYPVRPPTVLQIKVTEETKNISGPTQALTLLTGRPVRAFHDTGRSTEPFWFSFSLPSGPRAQPQAVEFPSRHARDLSCWEAKTLKQLGSASRAEHIGAISTVKAGFALDLMTVPTGAEIVCRTTAQGPARLSAMNWPTPDLQASAQNFHRKSGLLDGGMTVLAVFVLITAAINRKSLYVLFAAWLIVSLRMGALSAGWDTQWLGLTIPVDYLMVARPVTLALYYLLTLTLFTSLFKEDLLRIGYARSLFITRLSCFPLLALSFVMPYGDFLPLIWLVSGIGIAFLAFLLMRILKQTQSRVALWYSASIMVTLMTSLYEVAAAALGLHGLIGSVNSVTAALSSSLLAALAIAEHMRQEHQQRIALQAELAHTFEAMPIGLFTLDLRGRFLRANPALLGMLGPDVLQEGSNTWPRYFEPTDWIELQRMAQGKGQDEMEVRSRKMPGLIGAKRFLIKATLARDRIEGSLQDVTEKSLANEHLYFLANHDSLTRAFNRRGIETVLETAIAQLDRAELGTLAVAYLDLDRFKLINDLFGHGAGDEVLRQVCQRVSDLLSHEHHLGRVGGDEFVIVFAQTRIALAAVMCRRIVDSIGTQPFQVADKAFYVRGSIGLIEVSADMHFNDAMSTADRACREAKQASGAGLVVYEKSAIAFQKLEAELKLIALLSTPSATDGLYLEMQPIMSLTAPHGSLNFEVLLRMRDPQGKAVRTDSLIHAAESCGRMGMIDRWVLTTTLDWLDTHYAQMRHTNFVCVNLSGASLNDEKFLQDVYDLFESRPHLVRHLCLEITESVALHDLENTRRFVEKIRGYGAKIALDDFGAGYTSFSYLKEFTADLLKIDGSFIVNMNHHPANIAIVEAIVSLARNLGMKVIAEWAEDHATVQTLIEIGVDYVQGFVVAGAQHPDKLLTAASSASFIQDAELANHVRSLDPFSPHAALIDVFPRTDNAQVH